MTEDKNVAPNSNAYDPSIHPTNASGRRVTIGRIASILLAIIGILLWGGLLLAYLNADAVGDANPMLTPGVIELLLYVLTVLTCMCIAGVLTWRYSGKWKWLALPGMPLILGIGLWGIGHYYRVVFDADMNPIRVEAIARDYQLEPTVPNNESSDGTQLTAGPTDYPRFLGAGEDQSVNWLSWPDSKRDLKLSVQWRQPIGFGWSGFIAVGGIAYTMEQQGPWECVTAYDIATGKLIWVHKDRHRHDEPAGGIGPRSTPTFHEGRLYTLGAIGTLNCLDAATGSLIWQKELADVFNIPTQVYNEGTDQQYDVEQTNLLWGRSASPLIYDSKLVVPIGGVKPTEQTGPGSEPNLRSLAAFQLSDGEKIWEGGKHQLSYGSPTLVQLDGHPQILITNEATVAAHDPETGAQLWEVSRPGDSGGAANTSQPIAVTDNQVLLTKEYGLGGELIQVTKKDGQWKTESLWSNPRVLRTKLTVPIIHGDYAYCISGGILECTHWPTGERRWRGARVQHGQMLLIDDHLLVMSEQGTLMLVQCNPDDFIVEFELDGLLNGRCWNMLCVTGNQLLARSELEATCIQLPARVMNQVDSTVASKNAENEISHSAPETPETDTPPSDQ